MFLKLRWWLSCGILITSLAHAQEFGGIPSSLKLQQVNTPQVRVIYPAGLDSTAKRVAGIAQHLEMVTAGTIGSKQKKISIILQPETTVSNGYVQLAPWRSEFFMTPLQNSLQLGSVPWADQLAIHEIRHVQQYMNFRKGLSKIAYFIAGQEGQALANSAAVPDWFFEGDAVFQETLVTGQGRGRLPEFYGDFRALWEANRTYSYMKLRNGSFKHLTPNHYPLGYMLVSYGREKYGADVWKKITQDAVAFRPLVYPMQGALKKHTGQSFSHFVQDALQYYQQGRPSSVKDNREVLTPASERFITRYAFPQAYGNALLALKYTSRDIPRFVTLGNGGEKKLPIRDIALDDQFSVHGQNLVYAAYQPDIRWGYRDYSNLRLVDLATGKRRWLTHRSKYFSPDISHDGTSIAAIQVEPGGAAVLHILDAQSGALKFSWKGEGDLFLTYPRFLQGDQAVVMPVRSKDGRMSLLKVDLKTAQSEALLPFTYQPLAFPVVKGDTVFFTAAFRGQDRLMALDMESRQVFEVLGSYAGIHQSAPLDNGTAVYTTHTAWGSLLYRQAMQYAPIAAADWLAGDTATLATREALQTDINIANLPVNQFTTGKYPRTRGLFNFHSWRPFYEQPEWRFSLYGDNVLNTFNSTLSYVYNENESYHKFEYTGVYAAWFPWIQGGVSYTLNRRFQDGQRSLYWNEWNANLGLLIPLNLTKGRMFSNMYVSSLFNTQQVLFNASKNGTVVPNFHFNYLNNSIAYVIQTQKAPQQIFPRFALSLSANHRFSVTSTEAHQLLANAALYLPGILKTHSLVFNASYQARDTAQQYLFSNDFAYSRGYPELNYPRMWKAGVNYHLPLVYPDWGFGNIVYFLRIRGNAFYDYTKLRSLRTGRTQALRSVGGEIYFDTRWWNQQPVSFGIRYSRLLDADFYTTPTSSLNPNQWEFVLPINLISR